MANQMDQLYSCTISIYKSILDQFNPALENLVYLGNNYLQALNALSKAAEVYFNAIKKIGEQALQSSTSQSLGQILVQMADSHRHLNSGVERVFETFHGDILQHMEKNTKLDMQFIQDSHKHYEMEYRHRMANLDKCMADVWRMERMRDKNLREMKENVNSLHSDMQMFVSQSHQAAELEEKRRYRFLAEKQWVLSSTFFQFYSRACGILQNRVSRWKEQVDASREHPSTHSQMYSTSHGQGYPSNWQVPSQLEMSQRSLGDFSPAMSRSSNSILQAVEREQAEMRTSLQADLGRRLLQRSPSSGSLHSGQRSRSSSFGDIASITGGTRVRAIVSHSTSGNQTMLRFGKGDIITVLVPEAQNGWLYGRLEGLSETGWFPEAYVKSLEDDRDLEEQSIRSFALRSTHSTGDLLESSDDLQEVDYKSSAMVFPPDRRSSRASTVSSANNRHSSATSTASQVAGARAQKPAQPPELFPRGTNPFATVKLRPTVTNDRSAPLI